MTPAIDTLFELKAKLPKDLGEMITAMLNCGQTSAQTVYQHGLAVWNRYKELLDDLSHVSPLSESCWRIPEWYKKYRDKIANNIWSEEELMSYAVYHDCGKPYCRVVDEAGRVHFPNHAAVSQYVWNHVCGLCTSVCEHMCGYETVGRLIADDMVIHVASAAEIESKLTDAWSPKDAVSLLLAALAEIHANATMFGGQESMGFKAKWKTVERRGNQICKHLFAATG